MSKMSELHMELSDLYYQGYTLAEAVEATGYSREIIMGFYKSFAEDEAWVLGQEGYGMKTRCACESCS